MGLTASHLSVFLRCAVMMATKLYLSANFRIGSRMSSSTLVKFS